MSDARVVVGYVRRAHGIRGDLIVRSLSDDPDRFAVGSEFLSDETPAVRYTVVQSRLYNDGRLVRFDGVEDRTSAERLKGVSLTIAASDRRTLEDDEYWPDDLVGLVVIDTAERRLGEVTDVVLGDAQDRLVVTTSDGSVVEVPFVAAIVGDIEGGSIRLDPPEGLFPEAG